MAAIGRWGLAMPATNVGLLPLEPTWHGDGWRYATSTCSRSPRLLPASTVKMELRAMCSIARDEHQHWDACKHGAPPPQTHTATTTEVTVVAYTALSKAS